MCPVEVIRASEEVPGTTTLQQARENATRVIEDHRFYADAQARLAEQVRPRKLVDLLQGDYNLSPVLPQAPEPLPEEQVAMATEAAAQALLEERGRMGGAPSAGAQVLEEPPAAAPEGGSAHSVLQRPSEELADLFEQLASLPGELVQVRASIHGLGMRMVEISNRLQDPGTRPAAGQAPQPAPLGTPSPSPAPAAGAPPAAMPSLAQRRSSRSGEAPSSPEWIEQGAEGAEARNLPQNPSARNVRNTRLRQYGWAAAAVVLVGLAFPAFGALATPKALSEAELVERQSLGLGAYLRAEQAELERSSRRGLTLPTEIAQIQGRLPGVQDPVERRDLLRQLEDKESALQRSLRASQGLDALEFVSGVRRAAPTP